MWRESWEQHSLSIWFRVKRHLDVVSVSNYISLGPHAKLRVSSDSELDKLSNRCCWKQNNLVHVGTCTPSTVLFKYTYKFGVSRNARKRKICCSISLPWFHVNRMVHPAFLVFKTNQQSYSRIVFIFREAENKNFNWFISVLEKCFQHSFYLNKACNWPSARNSHITVQETVTWLCKKQFTAQCNK